MSVRFIIACATLFAFSFAVSVECMVLLGTAGIMWVLWFDGRSKTTR